MISSQLRVTLAGALILSSVPASAQDQSTLVPIAGGRSLVAGRRLRIVVAGFRPPVAGQDARVAG